MDKMNLSENNNKMNDGWENELMKRTRYNYVCNKLINENIQRNYAWNEDWWKGCEEISMTEK